MKTKNVIILCVSLFIGLSAVIILLRSRQFGPQFIYYLLGFGIGAVIIGGIIVWTLIQVRKKK